MVRTHSFLACVEEIVQRVSVNDVVKVGIVGQMGSGKTTLARAITHAFHTRMRARHGVPFAVREVGRDELLRLDRTLRGLVPVIDVLLFDDVSFLKSEAAGGQKNMAAVKNTLTTIRHRHDGIDVKYLVVYGYHYGRGLDKFLRQTDHTFHTTIGEEEYEYMSERHRPWEHGLYRAGLPTVRVAYHKRRHLDGARGQGRLAYLPVQRAMDPGSLQRRRQPLPARRWSHAAMARPPPPPSDMRGIRADCQRGRPGGIRGGRREVAWQEKHGGRPQDYRHTEGLRPVQPRRERRQAIH